MMVNAVKGKLGEMIAGQPAIIISSRCKNLRKALNGSYQYKRIATSGERYSEKPDKGAYSHIANAFEFMVDGTGASKELRSSSKFKEYYEGGRQPEPQHWSPYD